VFAIRKLPPDVQLLARSVYYDAIRFAFIASALFATCALLASIGLTGQRLTRDCKRTEGDNNTWNEDASKPDVTIAENV
jgi:hypothetical protein